MRNLIALTILLAVASATNDDGGKNSNKNDNKNDDKKKTPAPSPFPSPPPTLSLLPTIQASSNSSSIATNATTPSYMPSTSSSPTESSAPSDVPSSVPSISTSPSYTPSYIPSSTPSSNPTEVPSSMPSSSSMPSAAPWTYVRPDRVDVRFVPWLSLTETQRVLAEKLGYDQYSWENYGTNDVEYLTWDDLSEDMLGWAAELGFDQRSWDCWQNHYGSYRWIDLPTTHIQVYQFFDVLGYDINYWNGYTNSTPGSAETLYWYDLTLEERYAAAQLCFVRRSWDGEEILYSDMFPINKPGVRFVEWSQLSDEQKESAEKLGYENVTWNVFGLATVEDRAWNKLTTQEKQAAEELGFYDIAWDCWQNHFESYSWYDLQFYGLDMHYSALGWDELSWNGNTDPPSSVGKYWDLLNDVERENANMLCYFRDSWDRADMTPNNGPFPFRLPSKRYTKWTELPNADRQRAYDSLFYDECTWDVYGVADIESREWRNLTAWEKMEATKLGFIPNSWDCFQTHYLQKDWNEINWHIRDSMSVLGWDDESWGNKTMPDSYSNKWEELSAKEQNAAYEICYFIVNWPGGTDATTEEVERFINEVEASQSLTESDLADNEEVSSASSDQNSASLHEAAATALTAALAILVSILV